MRSLVVARDAMACGQMPEGMYMWATGSNYDEVGVGQNVGGDHHYCYGGKLWGMSPTAYKFRVDEGLVVRYVECQGHAVRLV